MRLTSIVICLAALLFTGCFRWQENVTLAAVEFEKARVDKSGTIIGRLPEDRVVQRRPCRQGWLHLHPNGVPSGFTAAEEIVLPRFTIPAGTWVMQDQQGVVRVCAFPRDTLVQGQMCRGGSGGAAGVQAAFYPSGALKQYFLREDATVQGVPCKAGLFKQSVELHEKGQIKGCELSRDFTQGGKVYPKGQRVSLDEGGKIL